MKNLLITILILTPLFSYSQKNDNRITAIQLIDKQAKYNCINKFTFTNGKELFIDPDTPGAISPNGQLIGLRKDLQDSIFILNALGDTLQSLKTKDSLRYVLISNNGQVALFGCHSNYYNCNTSLYLYDSIGNLKSSLKNLYGISFLSYFTTNNKFLFVSNVDSAGHPIVFFFDSSLMETNRFQFNDHIVGIPFHNKSINELRVLTNENNRTIEFFIENTMFGEVYYPVKKYKFNFQGDLLETKNSIFLLDSATTE